MTSRITAALCLALLASCRGQEVADPGWERGLAVTDPARSSVQMIEVPMTVKAGTPFTVIIRSFGSSSCTRVGDATVVVNGLDVDITAYNNYARRAPACTDDLHVFEHRVPVTVNQVGQARMRLHARSTSGEPLSYDFALTVHP
jgi:hypothetical protein